MGDFVIQGNRIFFPKVVVGGPGPDDPWTEQFFLTQTFGDNSDTRLGGEQNGHFVAGRTRLIYGAGSSDQSNPDRFIYIEDKSGGTFTETFTLKGSTLGATPFFFSSAIGASDDGTVVASANYTSGGGGSVDELFIFEQGAGSPEWTETIVPGPGGTARYGRRCDISGDGSTIAVGHQGFEIYVYRKNPNWTLVETINPGPFHSAGFQSISGDGSVIVTGLNNATVGGWSVWRETSANNWTLEQDFPAVGVNGAASGNPAINRAGTLIAVGDSEGDSGGFTNNGSVELYEYNGSTWDYVTQFTGPSNSARYGGDIALTDDVLVINTNESGNTGAVIYTKDENDNWNFAQQVRVGSPAQPDVITDVNISADGRGVILTSRNVDVPSSNAGIVVAYESN